MEAVDGNGREHERRQIQRQDARALDRVAVCIDHLAGDLASGLQLDVADVCFDSGSDACSEGQELAQGSIGIR